MAYFQIEKEQNIATNGTSTLTVNKSVSESRNPDDPFLDNHCIAIDPGGFTAGTITVTSKSIGGADYETVFESGSALVINLATSGEPFTRKLNGFPVESFRFVGASMTGGSGNDWDVTIVSGYD
jgi:hypothetical protein